MSQPPGLGVEVGQVRAAPAIRGSEPPPRDGGPAKPLYATVQRALRPAAPRPDPDLLDARHDPEEVDVPPQPLLARNVPPEARRQTPLRRPRVDVPTGRQALLAMPPGRQPPRAAEAEDEAVDARVPDRAAPISLSHSPLRKPQSSPITQITCFGIRPLNLRNLCNLWLLCSSAHPGGALAVKQCRHRKGTKARRNKGSTHSRKP